MPRGRTRCSSREASSGRSSWSTTEVDRPGSAERGDGANELVDLDGGAVVGEADPDGTADLADAEGGEHAVVARVGEGAHAHGGEVFDDLAGLHPVDGEGDRGDAPHGVADDHDVAKGPQFVHEV